MLFMIILEFVLMMILPWLIVYAVNGEDGLDYIITRAELSGSEKTLAKNSGWFRALQPVIELLLTASVISMIIYYSDKKEKIFAASWINEYLLPASIILHILLAVVILTVRRIVARQMRKHPLNYDKLLPEEDFRVFRLQSPGLVSFLSFLSLFSFFMSIIFGLVLIHNGTKLILLLFLSLIAMVFSLLRGHQERRRVRNIMVFRKKGILICGGPTGNLVPWNEISNVSLENENIILYRKNDESGESNEKTIISLKYSLIRDNTINSIIAQYRQLAKSDTQEEVKA